MNSTRTPLIQIQKFESIDTMRGIAILMVILVHTSQQVQGVNYLSSIAQYGQMGVQLFFIASAFTLCYSFDVRKQSNEPLRNFYFRRYFRIAPGYYFGILIYFFITALISYGWDSDRDPVNIILNILFLNGLFPDANNTVVPGGWSIGTEMIFYLFFPFLYQFVMSLQNKYRYTYLLFPIITLIFSFAIQFLISNLIDMPHLFGNNRFFYFNILNQLPVFCIGISLYIAFRDGKLTNINRFYCFTFLFLFSFIAAFLMLNTVSLPKFNYILFPFVSGLSFIFVFILLHFHKITNGSILAKVGVLSYSSYLIHFVFAIYLVEILSKSLNFILADFRLIIIYPITTIITYFTSKIIYKFIEIPGVNLGKQVIRYLDPPQNSPITKNL